jgi:serine/threonine protein kinase
MTPVGDNDFRSFLELVTSGGLETIQQRNWLWKWFVCLSSALAYLHGEGVRHQDIKPSNIIHKGDQIYFTDFSSSCAFEVGQTTSTENPARSSAM